MINYIVPPWHARYHPTHECCTRRAPHPHNNGKRGYTQAHLSASHPRARAPPQADRLRLFQESMGGVPSASAWLSQTHSKPQTAATDPAKYQGQSPAAAANAFPRDQGVGTGGRERGDGAGASNAPNEDGFYVLTVPDGKWTSPDLPPEAGRRPSGVVDCPSPVIGGSRPTGVRGAYGQRNNTTGARSAASTPQRR